MTTEMVSSECVRIVLIGDHRMFRDGLRRLIDAEDDLLVTGDAADADEAIALTLRHEPDIVLIDVETPDGDWVAVIEKIRAASAATRVIAVTSALEERCSLDPIHLGAHGVVSKRASAAQLLASIRSVDRGEYFTPREAIAPRTFGFTNRERQIVAALADGSSNKTIAEKFAISEPTVKRHLTNIFNKAGVSSRLELAVFAKHHHL